jgi:hypothetical protein
VIVLLVSLRWALVRVAKKLELFCLLTGRQAEPPVQHNEQFTESRCVEEETLRHLTRDFRLGPEGKNF